MKTKELNKQKWSVDDYWNLHCPNRMLYIPDLIGISHDKTTLRMDFRATMMVSYEFLDLEATKEIFDWLVEIRIWYLKSVRANYELHNDIQKAQLEIQNRMAGHIVR